MIGGFWAAHADSIEREFRTDRPRIARAAGDDDGTGASVVPAFSAGVLGADAALLGAVWPARDRLLDDPERLGI